MVVAGAIPDGHDRTNAGHVCGHLELGVILGAMVKELQPAAGIAFIKRMGSRNAKRSAPVIGIAPTVRRTAARHQLAA